MSPANEINAMTAAIYVVIGGSSGMGFAVAQRLVARGNHVMIGGRSQTKLDRTVDTLGPLATSRAVDVTDRTSLENFFADTPPIRGLFTPGASYETAPFRDGNPDLPGALFAGKFWAQYWGVHTALPKLTADASVLLMSGAASVRPIGASAYAACNAALEGLARALAVELAPIRVNCLSPGTIDSELWRNRPQAQREAVYEMYKQISLVGRPGTVDEAADAALFLLDNTNMTGTTLYCDGGYALR